MDDCDPKRAEPTIQEIKDWDEDELLKWIQQKQPKLLKCDTLKKSKAADINGSVFLKGAGNENFFLKAGLSFGASVQLAQLAKDISGKRSEQDVISQSSDVTSVKRKRDEQAEPAESSDTAFKITRLDSEIYPELLDLAIRARERRDDIITTLDQFSDAALRFSNPASDTKLPFPFIGVEPNRFIIDAENKWLYMGREKFGNLLEIVQDDRWRHNRSALWVYGTKGYGKSYLLAALVCYLSARKERVVYIPDCREYPRDPFKYFNVAMLFAWADDTNTQMEIISLRTWEEIYHFFEYYTDTIFIINQINSLAEKDEDSSTSKNAKGVLSQTPYFPPPPFPPLRTFKNHDIFNKTIRKYITVEYCRY